MTPKLSQRDKDPDATPVDYERRSFDGEPLTDYDSKTVVLTAERHDSVEITRVDTQYESDVEIPSTISVLQRQQRYYGPELLLHAEVDDQDQNYLLTAPGPTEQLRLWCADQSEEGRREGWTVVADVEAALSVEKAPYETCNQCGEEIRTIEHERMSVVSQCQR